MLYEQSLLDHTSSSPHPALLYRRGSCLHGYRLRFAWGCGLSDDAVMLWALLYANAGEAKASVYRPGFLLSCPPYRNQKQADQFMYRCALFSFSHLYSPVNHLYAAFYEKTSPQIAAFLLKRCATFRSKYSMFSKTWLQISRLYS